MSESELGHQSAAQQHMDLLSSHTLRAITEDPELYLTNLGVLAKQGYVPIHAPHLQRNTNKPDIHASRAISDSMAMRLSRSDYRLHKTLVPSSRIERLVFELLEQLRVEALIDISYPGMRKNVQNRFRKWSLDFHHSGLTDTTFGKLFYTVAQICWAKLNVSQVVPETEDFIESTRFEIAADIGHDLQGLRQTVKDQSAYALHALNIAKLVSSRSDYKESDIDLAILDDADTPENDNKATFGLILDFEESDLINSIGQARTGESKNLNQKNAKYQIYTTEFDRVSTITELVRADQLDRHRRELDEIWSVNQFNDFSMIRQIQTLASVMVREGMSDGLDSGYLDGRKLGRLVTNPNDKEIYWLPKEIPKVDAAVTFLVDCSGSMKNHAEPVCLLLELLAKTLEKAQLKTEILGYTTQSWHGGRAAKAWFKAGSTPSPGRLNEQLHIVFKSFDQRFQRARRNLAGLLNTAIYREGIDGEAVQWAAQRMLEVGAKKNFLVVISDGSPMDSATARTNDAFYLDNHLKTTVSDLQKQGLKVMGLGVGLDLTPFYPLNRVLDFEHQNLKDQFNEWLGLMRESQHH